MRDCLLSSVGIRLFLAFMFFSVPALADSIPINGTGSVTVMGESVSVNTPYGTISGGYCCGGWLSFLVDPSTGRFSIYFDIATVGLNDQCVGRSLAGCESAELAGNASGTLPMLPYIVNIDGSEVWMLPAAENWQQLAIVNVFWDFYDKIDPATGQLYPEVSGTWTGPATLDFANIAGDSRYIVGGDIFVRGGHLDISFPAPVPEPSTCVLLGTGLMSLVSGGIWFSRKI